MSTFTKPDVEYIFTNEPHLHLVVWDRLDRNSHIAGMQLARMLLYKEELQGRILPLFYSIGRSDAGEYYKKHNGKQSGRLPSYNSDFVQLHGKENYCELWIHASAKEQAEVWGVIREYIDKHKSVCAWQSLRESIWQPMGEDLKNCQYATTLSGMATSIICGLDYTLKAALLKLIWFRATEVICNELATGNTISLLDVREHSKRLQLVKLIDMASSDFKLSDYGILSTHEVADPTRFGASHLTSSALSAVIDIGQKLLYTIEDYWECGKATRPYLFSNRNEYINWLISNTS